MPTPTPLRGLDHNCATGRDARARRPRNPLEHSYRRFSCGTTLTRIVGFSAGGRQERQQPSLLIQTARRNAHERHWLALHCGFELPTPLTWKALPTILEIICAPPNGTRRVVQGGVSATATTCEVEMQR
jgi:hypothetical protein